jgi:hypothetical protein
MNLGVGQAVDRYTLQARLVPSLILLLPVVLVIESWVPAARSVVSGLISLLLTFGLGYLLVELGRFGSKRQAELYAEWGGAPTTQLLRWHRSSNVVLVERRHAKLATLAGLKMPTRDEETADRHKADAVYEAAVTVLRDKTRDRTAFQLIFEENRSYGMRRNLWAMKPLALTLAVLGFGACATRLWVHPAVLAPMDVACAAASALLVLLWWFLIDPLWVRVPADAYAERLFEALERLA